MGFLFLLSFVERPSSPRILLVCFAAFCLLLICVYLSKKKWCSNEQIKYNIFVLDLVMKIITPIVTYFNKLTQ